MVAKQLFVLATEVVRVVPLSTTPAADVVVLQSEADVVLQLVGRTGVGIAPLLGIVSVGHSGRRPSMVKSRSGHLMPGGPLL